MEKSVLRYLGELMEAFRSSPRPPVTMPGRDANEVHSEIAREIFGLLTSRNFSYMGRAQSEPYRKRTIGSLEKNIGRDQPAKFFFDLGPGYHASLDPADTGLVFEVGLAEFLALRQIKLFDDAVKNAYPPGVKFFLVIDNLCGLFTNDVPLDRSMDYVRHLRLLITQLGMDAICEVLAESEAFTTTEYEAILAGLEPTEPPAELSDEDIENIARFLGRPCCAAEAAERVERYRRTGMATESLLARIVNGVRLTQRATEATLGFRSFPGGAQRVQVGEIVVAVDEAERTRPVLMTSRNRLRYDIRPLSVEGILPPAVTEICYVRLLSHPDRRQRIRE